MNSIFLKYLLIMIIFNIIFVEVIGGLEFFDQIVNNDSIDSFTVSLNGSLGFVLGLRVLWLALNLIFLYMMRQDAKISKFMQYYLMFILLNDVAIPFYTSIQNMPLYVGKIILESSKNKFNGIQTRIYLYHYYKRTNNKEGVALVVNSGLNRMAVEDVDYLLEHRKDKEIKPLVDRVEANNGRAK